MAKGSLNRATNNLGSHNVPGMSFPAVSARQIPIGATRRKPEPGNSLRRETYPNVLLSLLQTSQESARVPFCCAHVRAKLLHDGALRRSMTDLKAERRRLLRKPGEIRHTGAGQDSQLDKRGGGKENCCRRFLNFYFGAK